MTASYLSVTEDSRVAVSLAYDQLGEYLNLIRHSYPVVYQNRNDYKQTLQAILELEKNFYWVDPDRMNYN